jgi:NAD(P)-dependent dehydrogenase (short-subunit alcohol dehydrogenase family)
MRGLDQKICVIAGAAPGNIGGATAHRLSSEGATVVVADLNSAAAQALADEIKAKGGHALAGQVDISSEKSFEELLKSTARDLGGVDHLFNVAADFSANTMGRDSSHDVTTVPIEVWKRIIDVTLTGYMYGIRHALPLMIARGGGSIVNMMSATVWLGEPMRVSYASAKAGVAALTRHTATIGGKKGVRCNAIAPGAVLTEAALRIMPEADREKMLSETPSHRLGKPEDIAALIAFLFSDDGEWINSQIISIDGGLVKHG